MRCELLVNYIDHNGLSTVPIVHNCLCTVPIVLAAYHYFRAVLFFENGTVLFQNPYLILFTETGIHGGVCYSNDI